MSAVETFSINDVIDDLAVVTTETSITTDNGKMNDNVIENTPQRLFERVTPLRIEQTLHELTTMKGNDGKKNLSPYNLLGFMAIWQFYTLYFFHCNWHCPFTEEFIRILHDCHKTKKKVKESPILLNSFDA